ncbi:DUF1653 domain-containing protein [Microbulbifer sp. VTAC004]|uniref:DUF1653 domain-containing protein n=1 Tax=Microbulbifer sp. VTAC004 TaxID=3243386 RepID=UPI00403974FB
MKRGLYRHHKGNLYGALYVATHSKTEEKLVTYRALYGDYGVWAKPLSIFTETLEKDGKIIPRFALEKPFELVERQRAGA